MLLGWTVLALPFVAADATSSAAAGGRATVLVGEAPLAAGQEPESALAAEVVPALGVRSTWNRGEISLRYFPRLFLRFPNQIDSNRPLLLHRAGIDQSAVLSEAVSFYWSALGQLGELDYTLTNEIFGPTQTGELSQQVTEIASVDGSSGLHFVLTRRDRIEPRITGAYRRFLDAPTDLDVPRESASATAGFEYLHHLTRRQSWSLLETFGYHWSTRQSWFVFSSTAGWQYRAERTSFVELRGGLVYADALASDQNRLFPVAEAWLESSLHKTRALEWTARAGTALQGVFDPLRGDYRPQLGAQAGLGLRYGQRWNAKLLVSAATSATSEPIEPRTTETLLAAELPVSYAITPDVSFEFGLRGAARAPHLNDDDFSFDSYEYWGFAGIRAAFATQGEAGWLL